MRVSDAIALGRKTIEAVPLLVTNKDGGGCAHGMALAAIGKYEEDLKYTCDTSLVWPWLDNYLIKYDCPCRCVWIDGYESTYGGAIAHLFDQHVFGKKDWTLDQLIDWVRSVELQEEEKVQEEVRANSK